jgi:hypothetical protein
LGAKLGATSSGACAFASKSDEARTIEHTTIAAATRPALMMRMMPLLACSLPIDFLAPLMGELDHGQISDEVDAQCGRNLVA